MGIKWEDLVGTTKSFLRIGKTGPRLKDSSGNLALRNPGDTADVQLTTSKVNNTGNTVSINSDAAGSGVDWRFDLSVNPAATAHMEIQAPPAKGTDGQSLRQKAGTAAGVVELEWYTPSNSTAQLTYETTSLAFGTASPLTMFTLPTGAVIKDITVVIDTAFNGTPSLSIGITGTTSKYMAASEVDLTDAAKTSFVVHPGEQAPGSPENIIATYAAGGASAGAARILVTYAVPV